MVSSLIDLLRKRAEDGGRGAVTFLEDGEPQDSLTFSELDRRARALATFLQSHEVKGRALLLFPQGLDFVTAFFGCLYAKVIAVPAYPPHPSRLERTLPRLLAITDSARPEAVLTTSTSAAMAGALPEPLARPRWIAVDEVDSSLADDWVRPSVGPDDLAFLQYTSGSTGTPKGVKVSHGNLIHNLYAVQQMCGLSADDVSVTWLPSFHDMGLIDGILQPVFSGCEGYVMSPAAFLQRPMSWLQAITRFGGTHCGGPNFAYELCARRARPEDLEALNLGTWRSAYNGAEPVREETLRRFAETFSPCGFRAASLYPCFGLAEGTLMLSGATLDQGAVSRSVSADALKQGIAREPGPGEDVQVLVSSGQPVPDTRIAVVDPETGLRTAPGEVGEIWACSPSVAQGYWGMPEESERTFRARLEDPADGPFLRTGDLGFQNAGELFVTGRLKDLIIIRGANHYPQDVELTAERSHVALRPGGGAAFSVDVEGEERLVLVHEVEREHRRTDVAAIAEAVAEAVVREHEVRLHAFVLLGPGGLPKTSSGKVQRSACRRGFLEGGLKAVGEWRAPAPCPQQREDATGEQSGRGREEIGGWLAANLARRLGIGPGAIERSEPFARYGVDSATAATITGELEEYLGVRLSPSLLYEYPSIDALARHLAGETEPRSSAELPGAAAGEPVAVVGLGCRFPGAAGPAAFWRLLREGVDAIAEVPAARWDLASLYDPDPLAPGKMNTRWGGFLEGIDEFDAPLFGISPREAERMDPQQRLLLEVAWETLEDAGIAPEEARSSATGVFVGISGADYSRRQLGDLPRVDAFGGTGNALSIAANRLSYFFDFHGPSLAVDTACSSALVAVHLACRSLWDGDCEQALAGGVNLVLDPAITVVFSKGALLAPDGRCKAFDARADGYVRSEGCGLVLLKPLSRALADGDPVYAVIRGSAVNQDGRSNGLTAPSPHAQEAVLREAYRRAGVEPGRVRYVEAHGTGTAMGDPIEAVALGSVLASGRPAGEVCAVGSVKSNLGHLEAAAGIAGLIKVALMLRHREVPPSLHFAAANPRIPFADLPLRVQRELGPWPQGEGPLLAGVSSFGFGGTNAHVVLEEAPPPPAAGSSRGWEVLLLSARTPEALEGATDRLAQHLRANPEVELADVAYTLQTGRRRFDHRRAVVARGITDAVDALTGRDLERVFSHVREAGKRRVAFLLPGLGDHYPGMAAGLYGEEPAFREEIDRCAEILRPHLERDLREVIFAGAGEQAGAAGGVDLRRLLRRRAPEAGGGLSDTALAQPAVFAVDWALARLWMRWGVEPEAMIGYSLGEYVAACLAGVFSLEEGLALVAERARLIGQLPAGGMVAVALPEEEARPLAEGLSVAAVNGPATCIFAGPAEAVEALQRRLDERGVAWQRLRTSHAFHSPMMEPVREPLVQRLEALQLKPPTIPYFSNVTGGRITPELATDPRYWGEHLCAPVRFGDGIAALLEDPDRVLLEVGPGQALASIARLHPAFEAGRAAVSTLRAEHSREADLAGLLACAGKLWLTGVELDASRFHTLPRRPRRKVALPTYPFERQRYWLEAGRPAPAPAAGKRPDPADWFYLPVWRPAAVPAGSSEPQGKSWLVFHDPAVPLGEELLRRLRQAGQRAAGVVPGERTGRLDEDLYALDPGSPEGYRQVLAGLRESGTVPDRIVHLWGVTGAATPAPGECQRRGFYSLLHLAQAWLQESPAAAAEIAVVTDGVQRVSGRELLCPAKATVLGLCRVIPQEHPGLRCRSVDLHLETDAVPADLAARLLAELAVPAAGAAVAWRGGERWLQSFEPLRLAAPPGHAPVLRPGGVYLITGGLGGISLVLARSLAQSVGARLVLTGRSGLPERAGWDGWLAEHGPGDATSRRILAVRDLESLGAEVLVLAADAADPERMREAVRRAGERFGSLHGVIHAAGVVAPQAFRPVAQAQPEDCEIHFRPKVDGVLALDEALRGLDLDFRLLLSSISTVLGGHGFAAYAAANAFLDAFAESREDGRWLSVDWDAWRVSEDISAAAAVAEFAMSAEEGAGAFQRVLAAGRSGRLVHSTGELEARIARWVRPAEPGEVSPAAKPASETAGHARPALQRAYAPARNELERRIAALWQRALGIAQVGIHDNFFDLGGNSLIGVQLVAELRRELGVDISNVTLFEAPTVSALARLLGPPGEQPAAAPAAAPAVRLGQEIAIVGMAGRFPGAPTVEDLWRNLRDGIETITFFSDQELLEAGIDAERLASPDYVKARPILAGIEGFDAHFFGFSPRDAAFMDPQHRIFLECAWQALENAGHDPRQDGRPVGVFAGCNLSTYLLHLQSDPEVARTLDPFQIAIGNDKDSLPTSVSYKLDLKGPSVAVQTHCSTSLVAVHLACQNLRAGECDLALAGGVSVRVPQKFGYRFQEGGQESPDGHCRSFDAAAAGTVFGDGAAVVVLKRLQDALADGDTIHAVIKGSAINNDGSLKIGFTAPSVEGQALVVQKALANAGVDPGTIGFVEGHGSATRLGDPIEVAALTRAFRTGTPDVGFCALGSVKSNVGHLDRAAGVTGLIKAVLALEHRSLPGTLHFREPSAETGLAASPFYVSAESRPWPAGSSPRRAGVNSLGMGGTNAHVVLEEAPEPEPAAPSRAWQLLLLSARTSTALDTAGENLIEHLVRHPGLSLADAAYTLQIGRRALEHRRAVLADTAESAATALQTLDARRVFTSFREPGERPVAFLFPGLGDHYAGMARELYRSEAGFRDRVDLCCEILRPHLGLDLRSVLYAEGAESAPAAPAGLDLRRMLGRSREEPAGGDPLGRTALSQPAVFVVDYALAGLWMDWGIRPWALMGYSLGEYVAACLSGVMSLADALALVAGRARLIQDVPAGAMLAVPLPEREARRLLSGGLSLAAVNGPALSVVSGPVDEVEALAGRLEANAVACQRLQTTHAFHSAMLEPIREAVAGLAGQIELHPPRIPFLSNVTGRWITAEEATDPAYWAAHMCETVRFEDGLQELLRSGSILLEVGPGQALTSAALQRRADGEEDAERVALPSLRHRFDNQSDVAFLLATVAKLWLSGAEVDWQGFHAGERRRRIPLPSYPFEHQRYWIDVRRPAPAGAAEPLAVKRSDLGSWFYTPGWQRAPLPAAPASVLEAASWLVFADGLGLGERLAERLRRAGARAVTVRPGHGFQRLGETEYTVRPGAAGDYEELLKHLRVSGWPPAEIAHLWSLDTPELPPERAEAALEPCFYSLLFLAQALGNQGYGDPLRIHAVSGNACDVLGGDLLHPLQATALGPCRVIPQEYSNVSCKAVDLDLAGGHRDWDSIVDDLLAEMATAADDQRVAWRGCYRWVEKLEPAPLPALRKQPVRLRDGGVYLITGGMGGLGLAVAEHLARTVRAKLVLVSRSPLPPREEWASWRDRQSDPVSRRIARVEALEAQGAEVLVAAADVADRAALAVALVQARARFGSIDGVVHAAGVPGEGLIQRKERNQAAGVLSAKVAGTLLLNELLEPDRPEFMVLFSSSSSITGGVGEVDYCAANLFLDAFAQGAGKRSAAFTAAVNWGPWQWDAWQDTLLRGLPELREQVRRWREELGISFDEGCDALMRILDGRHRQMAVLPQGPEALVAQARALTTAGFLDTIEKARSARPRFSRPNLKNPFVSPTDLVERKLAEVFQDLLGVDQVGVHDAFFELGGNSLIGLQVVARVQKELQAQLTVADLFTAPTVRGLAGLLARPAEEVLSFDTSRDRGRLRRQRRGRPGPPPTLHLPRQETEL